MISFNTPFSLVLLGLILVTIIDITGSILSRKLNFNYGYFTILSIIAYTYIGYANSLIAPFKTTLLVVSTVGMYDALVGWKISIRLKANMGKYAKESLQTTMLQRIVIVLIFAIIFGYAGFLLARK